MQAQEYRLTVPNEEVYNQIYKDYVGSLKQAKIMISDYYDTKDLTMLKEGVVLRQRVDDGRTIVQMKKQLKLTEDNLFISESKEEVQSNLEGSKMYHFVLNQFKQAKLENVLTLRTLRQMYFAQDFDFILDKTFYEDKIHNKKGQLFEIEMEILNLNTGDKAFIERMEKKYHLEKSHYTKMERILLK
ncbi:MAG: CYTH domain-containing protein [Patescibacteria group bacterium]|jgi:hypothetical protein